MGHILYSPGNSQVIWDHGEGHELVCSDGRVEPLAGLPEAGLLLPLERLLVVQAYDVVLIDVQRGVGSEAAQAIQRGRQHLGQLHEHREEQERRPYFRPLVPRGRRWRAAHKHSEEQVDEGVLSSLKAAVAAERAIVVERRAFSKMPAGEGLQVGQRLRPCSRTVAIHEPAFQQGAEQVQDAADMVDLLLPRPGVDDLEVLLHVRAQLPLHHGLDAMPLRQQRGAEQGAHDVA